MLSSQAALCESIGLSTLLLTAAKGQPYTSGTMTVRHSIYPQLLDRYRAARQVWRENASLRAVAADRGITERQWADDYSNRIFGLLTWSDTGTGIAPTGGKGTS